MSVPVQGESVQFAIAVIGSGAECTHDELATAEALGREIARRGAVLVCGGLGGVMEAACRGAMAEGGMTVGILPGDDIRAANPFVQIAVATGAGPARNLAVVNSARAIIAIGGKYGTLSEIAFALKVGHPVVGLNTWSLARKTGVNEELLIIADGVLDALDKAIAAAGSR
jgi:uncharacterized protein (TIGR00725 family)